MKIASIIARSLLRPIFLVFGSKMFSHFIPTPPPEAPPRDFMTTLSVSHYAYVGGAFQVAGGVLLLTGRRVPLGLTLLGPVIVNILCFHVLMAPAGLLMAVVVTVLALFLLWRHHEHFAGTVKTVPSRPDSRAQQIAAAAAVHSWFAWPENPPRMIQEFN